MTAPRRGRTKKAAPAPPNAPALPDFIPPQLATLVDEPPAGPGWLHEIKFDGYRVQLRVQGGSATLRTRRGHNWTSRFSALARAAKSLPDCILDGEAAICDASGLTNFAALQSALASGETQNVVYFAFDLLFAEGEDLRRLPLLERKRRLKVALSRASRAVRARIRYVEHFAEPGPEVHRHACDIGVEGIVSKKVDAAYRSGRQPSWVKCKCGERGTFVVGGWRERGGYISSLIVGEWRGGELYYVGKARAHAAGQGLHDKLLALETKQVPFARSARPAREERQHWAKPELTCEVVFTAWTKSRRIRHGVFRLLEPEIRWSSRAKARRSRSRHIAITKKAR